MRQNGGVGQSLEGGSTGRVVKVGSEERTLATDGLVVEEFVADWRTKLLATITNPNVAYMLLLVGIYGLIFEGYNPGALVPGIVGAICLLIAAIFSEACPKRPAISMM